MNLDEFLELINRNAGYKRVFASVYNYTKETKEYVQLDKLFFDFDSDSAIIDVQNVHHQLNKNNYKHIIFFSGNGFHIYVLCKNYQQIENKETTLKATLKNAQKFILKSCGLQFGKQVDSTCKGDIARIATMPNTWNTKRRRYCISISEEDIHKGYEHIKERAIHKRFRYYYYGHKIFDISNFIEKGMEEIEAPEITEIEKCRILSDDLLKELPKCIQKILAETEKKGNRKRFLTIIYLREKGFTKGEVCEILKKYLSPTEAKHCISEEHQVNDLFTTLSRRRIFFPNCKVLKEEGICPLKSFCKKGEEIYR